MRVKMIVAYDGTNYCGWQIQPNGIAIEQKLNEGLCALLGEEIKVTGASRTDAGVHSLGNVCVFDTHTRMPAEKISYALNQRLPEDIVVQDSCEVPESFHPRFSKSRKTYEYRILNRKFRMPTRRLDTYFYHHPLDVEKMQEAAAFLVGEHDFKSFCAANAQSQTSVRTIYECTVTRENDIITIRVTGNGFLYNMVRIIAGTLMKVGCGEMEPEQMPQILAARDRSAAGPTAPAHGLTMIGLVYEEKIHLSETKCRQFGNGML
jgi:tRNA pseudouridine38-40 synthase